MKKIYIIIIVLCVAMGLNAQSCLPEGITFTTQAQIDSFQYNHPGCVEIEGDVVINGYDITNLNGLSELTSIGGYLQIRNISSPTSLSSLENLTSIEGDLQIWNNTGLTSLSSLENLTSIGEDLRIWYNSALTNLNGLDSVALIGGKLEINNNPALTNLTGLENLPSIGGGLYITSNDALTSFTGLENLTFIGGHLEIDYNNAITSLTGLDNIVGYSISHLSISYNDALSHCAVLSICNNIGIGTGNTNIISNMAGCNSTFEVWDSCEANAVLVDENYIKNKLLIYPNPSSSQFTIELPNAPQKNTFLTLCNLNGQVLITQPITKPQTVVDVSALPSGVYFVKVDDDEKVMRRKVIKQ